MKIRLPREESVNITEEHNLMTEQYIVEKVTRAIKQCVDSSCYKEVEMNATPVSAGPVCFSHFAFPPPPQKSLRPMSASSHGHSVSDSDSQSESGRCFSQSSPIACRYPMIAFRGYQSEGSPVSLHSVPRLLPPIGVFWDIENCQVPKGRSAVAVAQVIRDRFFTGYREAEFLVVCDVKKENNQVIQELNDAQVNLIHVASTCKNAADDKLRQSIRRFAEIYGSPASIVLISGDINFAADINDLRHRKKIHVILLHKDNTSEALILCASEHHNFSKLVEALPPRGSIKSCSKPMEVVVTNLPNDMDHARLRARLKQLSDNCGGRVGTINRTSAPIRFSSLDAASRAQKRMEGEDVFGHKISVSYPTRVFDRERQEGSPLKSQNNIQAWKSRYTSREDNTAMSTNFPYQTHYHSGLCQSTPACLNLLGSTTPLNGWSGNVNGFHNAPPHYIQDDQLGEYQDAFLNNKENSRSLSPFTGVNWHPSWVCGSPSVDERKQTFTHTAHINGSNEKTPRGFRKIRGTHKASEKVMQWEQPDLSAISNNVPPPRSVYRPVPQQGSQCTSPMTLASLNLAVSTKFGENHRWSQQVVGSLPQKNCRTPSPFIVGPMNMEPPMGNGSSKGAMRSRTPTPVSRPSTSPFNLPYDGDIEESEHFFHPISNTPKIVQNGSQSHDPVELQVTNLDQTIAVKDVKRILLSLFRDYVMVQSISVLTQSDGNLCAYVKVPGQQDAQYAISKLQRRKIGYKRINISRINNSGPSPQVIRSQILTLLLEVPGHSLPLFKFCELFESRYLTSLSMSDIYKVKDVCVVTDGSTGRMVSLHSDHRNTPSPHPMTVQDSQAMELPYCPLHTYKPQPNKGWAEQKVAALPNVCIGLKMLAIRIHSLLQSHNGSLHLCSLPVCYKSQFELLDEDEEGVPLEHLVSCLPGIEIYQSASCIKYVRWLKAKPVGDSQETDSQKCVSPSLAGQLALFSRELVDLLKTSPRCQLPFGRFIPAYHHHFGRQCRVADYGFTKLLELLEALPHIVQVMGEGNKRMITLSHRVQVRRFTSDLLRMLKYQASKQLLISELPILYQRVLNRPWNIVDYGVCEVRDILLEVSDTTLIVTAKGDDFHISIPKREQTPEEMERTKQFAAEIEVVDGERHVTLSLPEHLKVFAEQVIALVDSFRQPYVALSSLPAAFLQQYGYALTPEVFDCSTLEEVMKLIPNTVEILPSQAGTVIALVDHAKEHYVKSILMEIPDCKMEFSALLNALMCYYNQSISLNQIKYFQNILVSECGGKTIIQFSPLQVFARNVRRLLMQSEGRLPLSLMENSYLHMFGRPCRPAQFGYTSLGALLQAIPDTVQLRGRGNRRMVVLVQKPALVQPPGATQSTFHQSSDCDRLSNGDSVTHSNETDHKSSICTTRSISSGTDLKNEFPDRTSMPEMIPSIITGFYQGCEMVGPDKPDTPAKVHIPSPAGGLWAPIWSTGSFQTTAFTPYTGPSVNLPWPNSSPSSPAVLLSPTSNLLPAYSGSKRSSLNYSFLPHVVPPEPSELPLPQLSLGPTPLNSSVDDASSTEGTPGDKGNQSASGTVDSSSSTPSRNRRKRRLAAQFDTPIDLP